MKIQKNTLYENISGTCKTIINPASCGTLELAHKNHSKYIQYKTIIKHSLLVWTQKNVQRKMYEILYHHQGYLIAFNYKTQKTCIFTIIETYGIYGVYLYNFSKFS
jgi:hypothetical protein